MFVAPLPQRLEMTFTSSGCETRSAMCLPALLLFVLAVLFDHRVHFFGREVLVEVVVDLHRRRPAAGADALDFFQREQAIRRRLLVANAQGLLAVLEDV